MSVETSWSHFFKPEVRSSGLKELRKESVVISTASDTQIQAYARGTSSFKITLTSSSIDSDTFTAKCTCPTAKRGNFCKHIWAALLATETRHPDFFESKRSIEIADGEAAEPSPMKAKQDAYRKEQYQKQKTRAKEVRQQKKKDLSPKSQPQLPTDVQQALGFFESNGFPMQAPVDEDGLRLAKKKLSRVFHPDLGGSHEETVILNRHFDVLLEFLNS
jgi:hypothetical protein